MTPDWSQVRLEHVQQACGMYDAGTAVPKWPAKSTFLLLSGKTYPAKFIRGLAHRLATGVELDPVRDYAGGMETVRFFRGLGLSTRHGSVLVPAMAATTPLPPSPVAQAVPATPVEPSVLVPQRRQEPQKEALAELLRRRFGAVEREVKFPWLVVPYPDQIDGTLSAIYQALRGMRGHSTFASFGISLCCDFFVPSGLIIEYDERQHFTLQRARAFELYPPDLSLGFDREEWLTVCRTIQATDPTPPYRDEQRAFYDSLRDILAACNGLRLIRLRFGTFDWTDRSADEQLGLVGSEQRAKSSPDRHADPRRKLLPTCQSNQEGGPRLARLLGGRRPGPKGLLGAFRKNQQVVRRAGMRHSSLRPLYLGRELPHCPKP